MEVRSKVYTYWTGLKWIEQKKGVATCGGKPDLQVATPPEFKGHAGIWSPEDLFVASVNVCVMSTFLAFAERAGLGFTAYQSEAEGRVELVEGKLQFTGIVVRPKLTLVNGAEKEKAKELLEKAERNCLISNSLSANVTMDAAIA